MENIHEYIKIHKDSFYGVKFEDIKELFLAIVNAQENKNKSEFPDFIFKNGFIEHFRVSASKMSRSGAKELIALSNYNKKIDPIVKSFEKECSDHPIYNQTRELTLPVRKGERYEYEFFESSFKTLLNQHLKSYDKYKGQKNVSIFIVECVEIGLEMAEDVSDDKKMPEYYSNYHLSKDRNLLKFLYGLKDKITYVIFDLLEEMEIIKVDSIPKLLKSLPYDFVCVGKDLNVQYKVLNYMIKSNGGEESE